MKELIKKIVGLAGKAQFASFDYTTKETKNAAGVVTKGGEIARYNIILGANYIKLIEKSLLELELGVAVSKEVYDLGAQAVMDSLRKSLIAHKLGGQSEDYTKRGQYANIGNGLNINLNDNTLQLFGLLQSKVVLKKGVYPVVKSAPLTLAKAEITKLLPVGKFREFALDLGNIHGARLDGATIVLQGAPEVVLHTVQPKAEQVEVKQVNYDFHAPIKV